jgi:hypothetical protein
VTAVLLALLLGGYTLTAQDPLASDKMLHATCGYVIADVYAETAKRLIPKETRDALWLPSGMIVAALAGAAKEGYDSTHGGVFDWRDLGCTAIGGGIAVTVNW